MIELFTFLERIYDTPSFDFVLKVKFYLEAAYNFLVNI